MRRGQGCCQLFLRSRCLALDDAGVDVSSGGPRRPGARPRALQVREGEKKAPMKYDLAVIGAGTGGLTAAAFAAKFGRKVVLFEKARMGGDCLNVGCVPSKALLAAAKRAHAVR